MKKHLGLFFTKGVSLAMWAQVGNLTRELAIYKRLLKHGYEVSFVTYGDKSDLEYSDSLGGIRVVCNETGLSPEQYEDDLTEIHEQKFREFSVIKTNQMFGADIALRAAQKFSKPFVARCGYLWSVNSAKENGAESEKAREADRVERLAFSSAHRISLTTEAMKRDVLRRLPECESKIRIIPNYVDTETFRPSSECERIPNQIIFIGRIAPEKNLASLFKAISSLDVKLVLIGDGPQRKELETDFPELQHKLTWLGNLPNRELPLHINRSSIFVLPSLYEGHPKALIEAMACAVPVIGCDSPGVREIVKDLETGILCSSDSDSIRQSINRLMDDAGLASGLGAAARQFICDCFSLDKIEKLELQLLSEVGL